MKRLEDLTFAAICYFAKKKDAKAPLPKRENCGEDIQKMLRETYGNSGENLRDKQKVSRKWFESFAKLVFLLEEGDGQISRVNESDSIPNKAGSPSPSPDGAIAATAGGDVQTSKSTPKPRPSQPEKPPLDSLHPPHRLKNQSSEGHVRSKHTKEKPKSHPYEIPVNDEAFSLRGFNFVFESSQERGKRKYALVKPLSITPQGYTIQAYGASQIERKGFQNRLFIISRGTQAIFFAPPFP